MSAVIPLESNPEIFTEFAHYLGLGQSFVYHDVYSLTDPSLLSFIPRPVHSVILLFPITPKYEELRKKEDEGIDTNGKEVTWFKQTVKNACGLFALLNSISNLDSDSFNLNSPIQEFIKNHDSPEEIEKLILKLKSNIYQDLATQGSTEAPSESDDVNLHFVSIIKKDGVIYELDGRRPGYLKLGKVQNTDFEDLLSEPLLAERFEHFVSLADGQDKMRFSVMALAPSFD